PGKAAEDAAGSAGDCAGSGAVGDRTFDVPSGEAADGAALAAADRAGRARMRDGAGIAADQTADEAERSAGDRAARCRLRHAAEVRPYQSAEERQLHVARRRTDHVAGCGALVDRAIVLSDEAARDRDQIGRDRAARRRRLDLARLLVHAHEPA